MGYGISKSVFYGLNLNPDQSKVLAQTIIKLSDQQAQNDAEYKDFSKKEYYCDYDRLDDAGKINIYLYYLDKSIEMIAENSNSSYESNTYVNGYEHCFGVVMGSSGYGSRTSAKDLNDLFQKGASDEHEELFERLCRPLLEKAGIIDFPTCVYSSCTI